MQRIFKHDDIQNTVLLLIKSCTFWYIESVTVSSCTRVIHFQKSSVFCPTLYNNVLLPVIIITTIRYCYFSAVIVVILFYCTGGLLFKILNEISLSHFVLLSGWIFSNVRKSIEPQNCTVLLAVVKGHIQAINWTLQARCRKHTVL